MRVRDIERVIEDVKTFLPEYLAQHGRKPNKQGRFRCPNDGGHKRGDKDPSCALVPGSANTVWHCFGCEERGTIFHAAYWIEQAPMQGEGFTRTLLSLADAFKVRYEEDIDAERYVSAYTQTSATLERGREAEKARRYIESRGLTSVAEHFEFGYANYDKLQAILAQTFDTKSLTQYGLTKRDLLHDRLVFPIRDVTGDVVAFASRRLGDEGAKYLNSGGTKLYEKGKLLYHLHAIHGDEVWVVEGYADVWTLTKHGIPAVACGGTAFTREHLELLISHGIRKMILCLDGDFAGQEAMRKVLPMLENQMDIRCEMVILPAADDEKDPDAYMRKHGADALLAMPRKTIDSPAKKLLAQTQTRLSEWNEQCWEARERGYEIKAWPYLTEQMCGFQKGLYLVPAKPNIGKTHWMLSMASALVQDNPQIHGLYFSLDDPLSRVFARVVAAKGLLPINAVLDPQKLIMERHEASPELQERLMAQREQGYQDALRISNRLSFFDEADGSTVEQIEKIISSFREITGRPLVVFIDSVNKVRTEQPFRSETEMERYISNEMKRLRNRYDLLLCLTVELKKTNSHGEPDNEDMRGAINYWYDAEAIFLAHNDMSVRGDAAALTFRRDGQDAPILQIEVSKNKLSSFRGRDYFRLFTDLSRVDECNAQERMKFEDMRRSV